MTSVTQDRVTFRRVEVESSAPQPNKIAVASKNNDNVQKEKPPSQQPQAEKPRWQPPPPHKKAVEDNDNSTITSLDSAQVSSQRQLAAGSIPRKQVYNVDNFDCRIYFPHWLLPDNVSRQRLFCEYPTTVLFRSLYLDLFSHYPISHLPFQPILWMQTMSSICNRLALKQTALCASLRVVHQAQAAHMYS